MQNELGKISLEGFIELLIQTKKPQIFAETSVSGNGIDWNSRELSILGDISIAVPVEVYDNGLHQIPEVHPDPETAAGKAMDIYQLRWGKHYFELFELPVTA